jgi:perosamine synthetase
MMKMWIRKRLDISFRDLLQALLFCFRSGCRVAVIKRIQAMWESKDQKALVCFSVRTGLDLLFRTLAFDRGSEILISALTIPDMPKIIRHHGLVPVPLDITESSLAPSLANLESAITPKTKAIIIAHLHGGICDLALLSGIARKHSLMVIEDCAQAYYSRTYSGDASADVSMFSFGTIKTATALGGGILIFRNNQNLYDRIINLYRSYPVQSSSSFFLKTLKYSFILSLTHPLMFAWIVHLLKVFRIDYDQVVHNLSKSFPGEDFFDRIRKYPSLPLLHFLLFRFQTFSDRAIENRIELGKYLLQRLPPQCTFPGRESVMHTFWVFPIMVQEPEKVVSRLRKAGFDATQKHSLKPVELPGDQASLSLTATKAVLRQLVYLPLYRGMPIEEIDRMARHLAAGG